MDTQVIELMGKHHLINALLKAGFEVAEPLRDRGVDLIAFIDVDDDIDEFVGVPIQLKASSKRAFSIHAKYNKFPDLMMAYVWHLMDDEMPIVYAMTQAEAVGVADAMGYTATASWQEGGVYSVTKPGKKLVELLEAHRMTSERWRQKLLGLV